MIVYHPCILLRKKTAVMSKPPLVAFLWSHTVEDTSSGVAMIKSANHMARKVWSYRGSTRLHDPVLREKVRRAGRVTTALRIPTMQHSCTRHRFFEQHGILSSVVGLRSWRWISWKSRSSTPGLFRSVTSSVTSLPLVVCVPAILVSTTHTDRSGMFRAWAISVSRGTLTRRKSLPPNGVGCDVSGLD